MPKLKPIWPMASPSALPPPSPTSQPWVGTDVWSADALEPFLDPQGSTEAGTQLEELMAKVSLHNVTSLQGDCVRVLEGLGLKAGHFIIWNDMQCTAHKNSNMIFHIAYETIGVTYRKKRWKIMHSFSGKCRLLSATSHCLFWTHSSYYSEIRLHVIWTTNSVNNQLISIPDTFLHQQKPNRNASMKSQRHRVNRQLWNDWEGFICVCLTEAWQTTVPLPL